jgi:hypothetical protein
MLVAARSEPTLTIDKFLATHAGREEQSELIDGTPQNAGGANPSHQDHE